MTSAPSGPPQDKWRAMIADATDLVQEHRRDGWDAYALRPGALTVVEEGPRAGVSVLVPDSEYETVHRLVERKNVHFDTSDIYRNSANGYVYVLIIEKDENTETTLIIPLAFNVTELQAARQTMASGDEVNFDVHVRPLAGGTWITFTHEQPSLFGLD